MKAERADVEKIAADVNQSILDAAVDLLTPQVVTEAVERATAEAEGHATAAAQSAAQAKDSATESARQANYANVRADRAEKARDSAEDAAARAEGFAGKLEDSYTVQMAVAGLAEQFYTLSDRVTKLELRHVTEDPDWIEPEPQLPPEGVEIAPGVTVAPVTLVEPGATPPSNAALVAKFEEYTP